MAQGDLRGVRFGVKPDKVRRVITLEKQQGGAGGEAEKAHRQSPRTEEEPCSTI